VGGRLRPAASFCCSSGGGELNLVRFAVSGFGQSRPLIG